MRASGKGQGFLRGFVELLLVNKCCRLSGLSELTGDLRRVAGYLTHNGLLRYLPPNVFLLGLIMNADDDFAQNGPIDAAQAETNQEWVEAPSEDILPASTGDMLLQARDGSLWSNFLATYQWSPDGTLFAITTSQYSATNNGSRKGNVNIRLVSADDTGYVELTDDDAIQDGQYHNTKRGTQVRGNARSVLVKYRYTYDTSLGDPHLFADQNVSYAPPAPTINPIRMIPDRTFTVYGAGGVGDIGSIEVFNENNNNGFGGVAVQPGGHWTAVVDIIFPYNGISLYARQTVNNIQSRKSTSTSRIYLAQIKSPLPNAVLIKGDKFSGIAAPGATVRVVESSNNSALTSEYTMGQGDTWETALNLDTLPSGPISVMASCRLASYPSVNTKTVTYNILGKPEITSPSSGSTQAQVFSLTGDNGLSGATIEVFLEPSTNKVGEGKVSSDGSWDAEVTLEPGRKNLAVRQKKSNKETELGGARTFNVRPNPPTLLSRLKEDNTVQFYGRGFRGAQVAVHVTGVNPALFFATVEPNGDWSQDAPETLLPGSNRSFDALQSVSDGGTGRISSGWSERLGAVDIPVPRPTGIDVTLADQIPTFSGKGRLWEGVNSYVQLYDDEVELTDVPVATVRENLSWLTRATKDFAPGLYTKLTARQVVNNALSLHTAVPALTVPSPTPTFTQPPSQTNQRPSISGTAWPGSEIVLKITDRPDERLTATGGTFTLDADAHWAPGTYSIVATATFGEQPSNGATRTFTVRTPMPRFTTSGDVDLVPIIHGQGWPGCWVVIYSSSSNQSLGSGPVGTNGRFAVSLLSQVPGNLSIYAKQEEEKGSSNVSEQTATLQVNVRVAVPQIQDPPANGRPARNSIFSGVGTSGGLVNLYIKGQDQPLIRDIPVTDGLWRTLVTLPAGSRTLEIELRYGNYPSVRGEHAVTVVPNVPMIDTPLAGEALGTPLLMSGFGFAGDTIYIDTEDGTRLGSTTVTPSGTWTTCIDHAMNDNKFKVLASAGEGLESQASPLLSVALLFKDLPQFTEPLPGDRVGLRPRYSGLATPGANISVALWFDTANSLAPSTLADEYGRWEVVGNRDLPEGQAWVAVCQTVNGVSSQWVESGRFIVEKMPAGFDPPIVDFPTMGQEVGRYPMFSGRAEPGATIRIVKEGEYATQLVNNCRVDRNGRWVARSMIELPIGAYRYSTQQNRDGEISSWLLPNRTMEVIQVDEGFSAAVIHRPEQGATELERRPLFAGTGMPGAWLHIFSRSSDDLYHQYASTFVDAQGHWSMRSDEELALGEREISCLQRLDGKESAKPGTVYFSVADVIARPVVTSPNPSDNNPVSPRAVIRGTALPGAMIRLVTSGDPDILWGAGIADAQGQWVIVTTPLPLGRFHMAAGASRDGTTFKWTGFELDVLDLG